jgi:dUTP pyrophosphatase
MIEVVKLKKVRTPERGTDMAAGIDFFVPNDFPGEHYLAPGDSIKIPSGIKVRFPEGNALIAFNKSGVAADKSLIVGACVVDSDYTGEIHIHVINVGDRVQTVRPGDKLVQFILMPVHLGDIKVVEALQPIQTKRGDGGFGSTNK